LVEENGYSLRAEQDEIVELMLRIEDKSLGVEKIAEWIRQRAISQFELGTDS
jgi:prophage maintenance system killer protein